jgi:deoxyribose-phosphate aldolase
MSAQDRLALAGVIDHTLLRPEARAADIERLCAEARDCHFATVCVHGCWVELARHCLDASDVRVACVVGFPLGAAEADVKRFEAETAAETGAHELDVVLNIGRLKDGDHRYILRELRDIVAAAEERIVKVILETCLLTDAEKTLACRLVVDAGAHFVKTSTGFAKAGATVEDTRLLRQAVGPRFGVKAAGGIRDLATARALLDAGANRLGTSAGVALLDGLDRFP